MDNKFGVGAQAGGVRILMPPKGPISKEDAIELAAWLVITSGDYDGERFKKVLDAATR